jgi:hypothetical protein
MKEISRVKSGGRTPLARIGGGEQRTQSRCGKREQTRHHSACGRGKASGARDSGMRAGWNVSI